MTTNSEELKPCPFCGGTDLEVTVSNKDREGIPTAIACTECGVVGPWLYCPNDFNFSYVMAGKEWNTRHSEDSKMLDWLSGKARCVVVDGAEVYRGRDIRKAIRAAMGDGE